MVLNILSPFELGNFRFSWLHDHLESTPLDQKYCSILSTDLRDVYFQGDFFQGMKNFLAQKSIFESKFVVLSQEGMRGGIKLNSCPYHVEAANRICVKKLIQDYVSLMEKSMLCSGSVFGNHDGILELMKTLSEKKKKTGACLSQPLTDQIILNVIVYEYYLQSPNEKLLRVVIPDNMDNPMLVIGNVNKSYLQLSRMPNRVARVSLLPSANASIPFPPYIHQYDRFHNFGKKIRFGLGAGYGQAFGDKEEDEEKDEKDEEEEESRRKRRKKMLQQHQQKSSRRRPP
jgi:hypothetical protein